MVVRMAQKPLDKAVMQEAVNAIAAHDGNVQAAARHLGLSRSTLKHRRDSAKIHGVTASGKIRNKNRDRRKEDIERIKALETQVARYEERLDKIRKSKFVLPTKKTQKSGKGSYCRVVIPDSHGAHVDEEALGAFLFDLEKIGSTVGEVVMLGDHLDCGGFLAQHQTLGYVAETAYTFEDDVNACNQFLDRLQKLCPKAKFHYLEGNHERRIEKWCVTEALGKHQDAAYLKRLFGVDTQLGLSKRGIHLYEQGKHYHDITIPATIRLGKCYFTHGSRTSKHAASDMLNDFGGNVVFGHTHRADSYVRRTVTEGTIGAWNPGCLCKLQPFWRHTGITGWSHGYGLQFVQPDGAFLHVNVPIISGKSYLIQLTSQIAA